MFDPMEFRVGGVTHRVYGVSKEQTGVREANARLAAHPSQKRQIPPGPMELMKAAVERIPRKESSDLNF